MRAPLASTATSSSINLQPGSLAVSLYLQHGSHANSFAAAFDADLQRWTDDDGRGVVASACSFGVRFGFFDPLCATSAVTAVLDAFLKANPDCSAFWKINAHTARELSSRGWYVIPYGTEHDVQLQGLTLAGTRRRGLRRELAAARQAGLTVEIVQDDDDDASVWDELRAVTRSWLRTRTQRHEIRRATRRTPHALEPYCSKCACRSATGQIVGWAAFDHIYRDGRLIGAGLNAVRWEGGGGVASVLALEGAALVRAAHLDPADERSAERLPFTLALGESPFSALPKGVEWLTQLSATEAHGAPPPRTSRFLQALFGLIRRFGEPVYAVRGLETWKRKWRAESAGEGGEAEVKLTFIAVKHEVPLREVLAAVALVLI